VLKHKYTDILVQSPRRPVYTLSKGHKCTSISIRSLLIVYNRDTIII